MSEVARIFNMVCEYLAHRAVLQNGSVFAQLAVTDYLDTSHGHQDDVYTAMINLRKIFTSIEVLEQRQYLISAYKMLVNADPAFADVLHTPVQSVAIPVSAYSNGLLDVVHTNGQDFWLERNFHPGGVPNLGTPIKPVEIYAHSEEHFWARVIQLAQDMVPGR